MRHSDPATLTNPPADAAQRLTKADFNLVARNGFGDGGNTYAHAMGWFDDALYVGFTRHALCGARPYDRQRELEIWPVKIPEIHWDLDWRGQIWRYRPRTGKVERVHLSPIVMGSRGFNIPRQWGYRDMVAFQGLSDDAPALYVTSWGSHMGPGPYILRCEDGDRFEEATPKDEEIFGGQTLRALVRLRDKLYTIPTGRCGGTDTEHAGVFVLESADPRGGEWVRINVPSFGDQKNVTIFDIETFNDHLYAGTMNPYDGFQVWKTDCRGKPPYRWTKVMSGGAGRGKMNEVPCTLCAFNGAIYIGISIYNLGFDRIYNVGPGLPEMVRLYPDDSWDLVVGEPRNTPDGFKAPASGFPPGFNNIFCGYFWRMCVHAGRLYLGTCVWSPWIPFARRDRWADAAKRFFKDDRTQEFLEKSGGFDLWSTGDGDHWELVFNDGLNNPFNCGARTLVSTPYGLCIGTVNQFAPHVATKRTAGWRYEMNPRGGAEVWIATPNMPAEIDFVHPDGKAPEPKFVPAPPMSATREDELLHEFYGGTGWRHVGFWGLSTDSAKAACLNLMEELHAFLLPDPPLREPRYPDDETFAKWRGKDVERPWELAEAESDERLTERILDLNCGLGASTRWLLQHYEPRKVVGLTDEPWKVKHCRDELPDATFELVRLPRLPFADESFDRVFAAELPRDTAPREQVLAEVRRVLKPGGRLVYADVVAPGDTEGLDDAASYDTFLFKAGFDNSAIHDVTEKTLHPLAHRLTAFVAEKMLGGDADAALGKQLLQGLGVGDSADTKYFIVSTARVEKPADERRRGRLLPLSGDPGATEIYRRGRRRRRHAQ